MNVTLHNTDKIVHVNGVEARVWEGTTEGGVRCFALIPRIGCALDADASEFERELVAQPPATADFSAALPPRLVI